jgi:tRNA pseudouridine55 synthase
MDGILIIDKPAGITSHDVVSRVRRLLKMKRVGHTGTLDPFATGVMVILVGQATRLAQFLDKDVKEYEALVRFGFETDTGDRTGIPKSKAQSAKSVDIEKVRASLDHFRGEILQVPPMYSAKKIDGKRLYEHARKGETIERRPIPVKIYELELSEPPAVAGGLTRPFRDVNIRVKCSAGTYIRTLAEDIGRTVGTGAHLHELRRTRAGKFEIGQSLTLEKLEQLDDRQAALVTMERAVSHLPNIVLDEDRIEKTRNGLSTRFDAAHFIEGDAVQMLDGQGRLIAIGFYHKAENSVQPKVVLV